MSYKTNAKSLRLGITHQWFYKAHGPIKNFHFDHKIKNYIQNLVEFVVPPAPKNVNTKKSKIRKFPVQPGLQGKTVAFRSTDLVVICTFYYLNYDGATPKQIASYRRNVSRIMSAVKEEANNCVVKVKLMNYFIFFWRYEGFLGLAKSKRLHKKFDLCAAHHEHFRNERNYYKGARSIICRVKNRIRRGFRRERYFKRTFYPLISSFLFFDFDSDIAARAIAFELQILRINHKKFVRYIRRFFKISFKIWNEKYKLIEGLRIKINGRLTNYRRQSRRTQTKIFTLGYLKKSHTALQSGYSASVGFNRYGAIAVHITYQLRPINFETWNSRNPFTAQSLFSMKEVVESFFQTIDLKSNQVESKVNFFNQVEEVQKNTIHELNKIIIDYKAKKMSKVDHVWHQPKKIKYKRLLLESNDRFSSTEKDWNDYNNFKKYLVNKK